MKTVINIAAFALVVTGVLFKANHLMGANISIVLSVAAMLSALFMFGIKDNKEAGLSDGMNYFLCGTLALFIVGILFKIMHWPGAGIFVYVCYGVAFILPLILILQKNEFKVSKQFVITFFTYFILLITLFPNNPLTKYFKGGNIMNSEGYLINDSTQTHTHMVH